MKKIIFRLCIFLLILFGLDWGVSTFLRTGLERYYGIGQDAEVLIIGHSHMMKSCNKKELEKGLNKKIAKYCREGVLVKQRYFMVKHFLEAQKNIPYVLYGVDPMMFGNSDEISTNAYKIFYPFMETPSMDAFVRENASLWDYTVHKYARSSRYSDTAIYRSVRGWIGNWESLASGVINDESWNRPRHWEIRMPEETVRLFHNTLDLLLNSGAHVVLVYPSIIKSFETSNPEAFQHMMNYFQSLADNNPNIDFLNYAPLVSHRQELFEDSVHLNREGEAIITKLLIRDVNEIIGRKDSVRQTSQ